MNESVGFAPAVRNSLILTGEVLRTFSTDFSVFLPHFAMAARSPLNSFSPEVTSKVTITVWPGATGYSTFFASSAFQPEGTLRLRVRSLISLPVVLTNFTATFCVSPGKKVWRRLGLLMSFSAATVRRSTSYWAATTLSMTAWLVSCVGNVPGTVMAPS